MANETYLHRMGRKPAYSSRTPPSLANRVNPETRPVAYPRWETSRIRVASNGVSRISAKNLVSSMIRFFLNIYKR